MAGKGREPASREAHQKLADSYLAGAPTKPHNAYYERPATMSLLRDAISVVFNPGFAITLVACLKTANAGPCLKLGRAEFSSMRVTRRTRPTTLPEMRRAPKRIA